jgi:hypothetical protein
MPLNIRGESFLLPTENNTPGPTGREVITIEETFGLDGLTLLGTLADGDKLYPNPAYSKVKALYALAWICMTRAGKILSIDDVLNTYSIDEISAGVDDPKKSSTAEN